MSETNSEIVWYIAREGEQHGPLSDAEMKLFVTNGHLKPTDLVWNPEMADWQTAASVFPPPAPPSPPPPPATPKVTSPAAQGTYKQPAQHDKLAAQNRTPGPALQVEPGSSAAAPNAHAMPSADAAHASLRPEPSLTAGADMAARQPAPVEGYEVEDEDDEPPRRRGRIGLLIGTVAVAAAIAGGGVVAFQNKDAILSYMNEPSEEANTPVVKADTNTKTAALEKPTPPNKPAPKAADSGVPQVPGITVTVPATQPVAPSPSTSDSVPLETIDSNLQKSQLWRVIKTEFPDWYKERVQEISKLSNTASETDLSKHLIGKLVALRREHAKHALSSSTEHLQSIAGAFLANLKSLAGHSTDACYTFISKGETSPAVISLFPKPGYGDAIEGQIAAVFRAVADGRKSPVKRDKATKPDYDILSSELTKIGWSKADVGLFANPQALAKAPPEQVCKMVQDWFAAHIAINDKQVQERLLVETLRPVVAG